MVNKEKKVKGAMVREFQIRLSVLRGADAIDIRKTLGPPTTKPKAEKPKTTDEVASR